MASTTAERDVVRVTVRAGEMNVDLSLPNKVPLRQLSVDVAKTCVPLMVERAIEPDWLKNPTSEIMLAPAVGRTWSPDVTLDRVGVRDGDYLILSTTERNERYPELIEVMQDATVAIRNGAFGAWESATSVLYASIIFPVVVSLLSLVGAAMTIDGGGAIFAGVLLAVAAACAGLSLVISTAEMVRTPIVVSLSTASYMPAAVAIALFIPGGLTHWAVLAGCATAMVMSILNVVFKQPTSAIHMAVATFSSVMVVGIGISSLLDLWRDMPVSTMAACVVTASLLVFYFEPGLSRQVAQLELPYLPLDTETGEQVADAEISEITKMLSQESSWESMLNQRDRNLLARSIGVGIGIGAAVSLALGCVVALATIVEGKVTFVWPELDQRSVMIMHVLVCCLLYCLQGSWYRDKTLRGIALTGGVTAAMLAMLTAGLRVESLGMVRVVIAVIIVMVAVLVACAVAWRARPSRSLRMRQWGEKIEAVLYLLPLVNIASLINIFFLIRHR